MDSHEQFVFRKLKKVASLIPEGSVVLDVGCNDGMIRRFLKDCDYYGIDIDKEKVVNLRKQKIKAEIVDLNKEGIPFKNKKFDYILLLDILEHLIDPAKIIKECKGKIKKEGKLIISLPNDYHILNKIRFIFNKHLTEDPFSPYGHLHYFPIKSGEKLILNQGAAILKKINFAPVKPKIVPQSIKNFLTRIFPQSFARDTLYVVSYNL